MKGKIFNAQEVQSMISGNKRMFREVIKPQPRDEMIERHGFWGTGLPEDSRWEKAPYQVGQKIFCKESFSGNELGKDMLDYMATPKCKDGIPTGWVWKPAQHMKQEHSRLTLEITGVRVERLADISEEDAIAEGCKAEYWLTNTPDCYEHDGITAVEDFAALWDETHKKPEEKFEASPFVFVYEFNLIK